MRRLLPAAFTRGCLGTNRAQRVKLWTQEAGADDVIIQLVFIDFQWFQTVFFQIFSCVQKSNCYKIIRKEFDVKVDVPNKKFLFKRTMNGKEKRKA